MADKKKSIDIGVDVKAPKQECDDPNCPFHGGLPIRGQILTCTVDSKKMDGSILAKREYKHYVPKYERYEKRTSKYAAHCPPCINVDTGDKVRIAECRPLSKTISFVVIEKM